MREDFETFAGADGYTIVSFDAGGSKVYLNDKKDKNIIILGEGKEVN